MSILHHIRLFSLKNACGINRRKRRPHRIRIIVPDNDHFTPVKLGITGGVGSGKSTVCACLARKGMTVVKTDDLARTAVLPGTPAYGRIVSHFSGHVVTQDGLLDRQRLRDAITRDPEKKAVLEGIIHPEVFRLMAEAYDAARERGEGIVAVEVPLLFEVGMERFFDATLLVCADRDIRIRRIIKRDHVTKDQAEALIGIQMPDDEKRKKADYVIENNGPIEETCLAVDRFLEAFFAQIRRPDSKNVDKGEQLL
jgi:dephospho-CoA kinase